MRLFVAIDISEKLRSAIDRLQHKLKDRMKNESGIKWVNPELMHLTLKFLGEAEESKIEDINQAVESACRDKEPFEFAFSTVGTFGRPARVLWLGSEKQNLNLAKLAADIENALEDLDFEKEQRDFNAHLTLARIKSHSLGKTLQSVLNDFSKIDLPTVSADSVCMYKSQLTPTGPVYTLLKKFEL
ncbi:MAG: 2'-5' RNA ligase [Planctomycetes bacterium RBG_13_44_8b]|nr:MAG: 2'-5' RNA ligase [Planctomycetes bacterium RBG_13_44_8b]